MSDEKSPPASGALTLDHLLRELVREVVRDEVRAALVDERAVATPPPARGGLLTIDEAAAVARVDPATIRAWIRRGHLGTYRAGRLYRVERRELDTYLARPRQLPPTTDLRKRARDFLARRDRRGG